MTAVFTLKQLTDARACSEQVELFKATFGESVNVTVARARNVADKFDWDFAVRFLDSEGKAEYDRVSGPALAEYQRVKGQAWASAYIATCKRAKVTA